MGSMGIKKEKKRKGKTEKLNHRVGQTVISYKEVKNNMMQKQNRKHGYSLFIVAMAIVVLGTFITPILTTDAEAVNTTDLTISGRTDTTVKVTWGVSGLTGSTYKYDIYVTPMGGTEELKESASGVTTTTKTVTISGLQKGTSYTIRVVVTDENSMSSVTKTTTFTTTGATGIAAIEAVFWNAYAALVAIVWLICIGVAAYYLAKRTHEEDDRTRGKQFQYAIEAIITGVIISILPLIAAMAQGWVQI